MTVISRKSIFICLLFSLQQCANGFKIGYVDIKDLVKFGYDIAIEASETWNLINTNPESDNSLPILSRMEKEIKSRIVRVSDKIDSFQEQMDVHLDAIVAKLLNDIPLREKLDRKIQMLEQFVGQINDLYNMFVLYSKAINRYEKYTLEDFAKTCVSSRSGALPDILKSIHRLFVPSADEVLSRSILILLANQMHVSNYLKNHTYTISHTFQFYTPVYRTNIMKSPNILICLLFLSTICGTRGIRYDVTVIDGMRNKLLQLEESLENDLFNKNMFQGREQEKYLWLINNFKKFGDELEKRIPTSGYEYLNSLNNVPLWVLTEHELREIESLYKLFRLLQRDIIDRGDDLDLPKLTDFLSTMLQHPNASIVHALDRIGKAIVQERLFVSAYQEASSQICNENQSLQQLLYNLYSTVTLAEIKGYSVIQFSYKLLRLYTPGANFTEEMKIVKQQYVTRTLETIRAVKTAMAFTPRQVWKCDPKEHKLDETYTKLTELFQGYIVNEVDLNGKSTCRENCGYYEYTKVHGCYQNQFCDQQRRCKGRVLKCEYIDSDMWICPASQNSDRRYEYIQYKNGNTFGQKNTCKNPTIKVNSWWRWLFWHCSYCFCYCDDSHANSDRYFSLRKVMSDVANNKVVTGIRFKKVNQIIHMQIQQGELMSRGNINESTIEWKPVDAFNILDSNVTNSVDYHTLSWEKRGLDLDDYVLDGKFLLTGVKFRTLGSRLNLEVRMTPFNFTTGKLLEPTEKSFWISHDKTDRYELAFPNADIPTRSPLLTLPDSKEDNYINFTPSSRKADAAQNTIPFVDIQPVELKPPVAIAGVGVFHKGRTGSGGYVALRLITYDYSPHLQVNVTPTIETVVGALSAPDAV
ncbi:hypothetical protein WH47_01144 [Habropoda laboriosa]|uniref:Vitellogenin domain-containing protein n=1 Tax=Habropoda laboriosa TaxID=597456 RepID=A0A0L7QYV8_9HYME|nr:hypothetical protein WH47_01144 [Habropoda laboriosa]